MKDAHYFPHDSNARADERLLELRAEYGWEGYGLWWALVEQLREATDYRLSNERVGGLAMGLGVPKKQLENLLALCFDLGLLALEDGHFFAPALRRRMSKIKVRIGPLPVRLYSTNIKLWYSIRDHIFKRDDYTCAYCGQRGGKLEVDHILAVSKGGDNDFNNLTTACRRCNRRKRDKSAEQFRAILERERTNG